MSQMNMEKLVAYCKQQGFVFQGSEIYGGLANTWDFGPLGVELKNNLKKAWWKRFVQENPYNVGLDAAILMNKDVWIASGHVGGFSDPLIDCKSCNTRHRADKLIEEFTKGKETGDNWDNDRLMKFIVDNNIVCPNCGKLNYTEIRKFNLMYKTSQGVIENEKNIVYLRPETAQGIFVQFKNIQRSSRRKVPFGICQVGKAFRNEITPGNFIFRVREFEQMELEFFCKPGSELDWFKYWMDYCVKFLTDLGIDQNDLSLRNHGKDELSFYSNATTDIEYRFPWGFGELWGVASRTDYDLTQHQTHSKEKLEYIDPDDNSRYLPYVVEPSLGVERLFLAVMFSAYDKEVLENNEEREVLRLHPYLAPYKIAVFPLIKKIHSKKANEIYTMLAKEYMSIYDDAGNIGKRYRRMDAIGTPYCITIDDETLNNETVTVRNRDTMEQVKVSVNDLNCYLRDKLIF